MKLGTMINQSLRNLAGNPVRSVLTVLGVVIGIAAVIAVVAVGKGLQQNVSGSISSLNPERITLTSQDPARPTSQRAMPGMGGPPEGGGGGAAAGQRGGFTFNSTEAAITPADVTALSSVAGVTAVSPEASKQLDVTTTADASTASGYQVVGVASAYAQMKDLTAASGAWLTADQVASSANVVVLGSEAATELFPAGNAVGQTIYVSDKPMTVVGVLAATATAQPGAGAADSGPPGGPGGGPGSGGPGGSFGSADSKIFTGYLEWASMTGSTAFSSVLVDAASADAVEAPSTAIDALLRSAHGIADGANSNVGVQTAADILAARSQISSGFTTALTGIAAVSLLVGGIGIMNIMLVTVSERTREIGLRRAVGAKRRAIAGQFLVEALVLTLIGGVLGLGLGFLLSLTAGSWLTAIPGARPGSTIQGVVDPQVALLAVGIAAVIGMVFGLFPAIRAARMDPAAALRYE